MDPITLIFSTLALSMDNFTVALVVTASMQRRTPWQTFRLCGNFGVFQSLMTLLGCLAGAGASSFMGGIGCWISFALLMLLGINMIRESPDDDHPNGYDPTKGWRIIVLSLACAIDALFAGVSLSLMDTGTWMLAPVFGICAASMAFLGTRLGSRTEILLGRWPQRLGGCALIVIGLRGVVEHLIHT
jgi:manganese efflux pump family protein